MQIDFGTISVEGCDKSQKFLTPFGKAKIKRDIEGAHGPRTQPGAGTELGKDRWSLYSINRVGDEGFVPRVIRQDFTLSARHIVWSMDYVVK